MTGQNSPERETEKSTKTSLQREIAGNTGQDRIQNAVLLCAIENIYEGQPPPKAPFKAKS